MENRSIIINVTQLNFVTFAKCPLSTMNTGVSGIFLFSDFYYLRLNVTYSIIKHKMIHLVEGDLYGIV